MRSEKPDSLYDLASAKANEIEAELKLLRRWTTSPLPPEKFENMGAFGCNTMSFEQWLQFVLLPRIEAIVRQKDQFPQGSMLGPYAIRIFDGDLESTHLHDLLYELDEIVNTNTNQPDLPDEAPVVASKDIPPAETVTQGDTVLPQVLYTLSDLLPQFDGDGLDSQLQTYDMFISILAPSAREEIARLLINGAGKHPNEASKIRIQNAAQSILKGGRATEPHDHGKSMRNYEDNFNPDPN
jgi:uncharacterized protein YqcC (DUF446 family)